MITVFITGVFVGVCIVLATTICGAIIGRRRGWLDIKIAPGEGAEDISELVDVVEDINIRLMCLEESLAPYLEKDKAKKSGDFTQ